MKNFLGLILIVGLLSAAWINRDKFTNSQPAAESASEEKAGSSKTAPMVIASRSSGPGSSATPHPARESQAQATALYPGISLANSALNKKFVALYKESQTSNPALLTLPDWPLQLAERSVVALGGAPMQRNAPQAAQSRAIAAAKPVVIYTTSHCTYCTQAKQYFTGKKIPYREINIDTSSSGKDAFRKLGGKGTPLIMVGTTKVEGFDSQELDRLL